ncbi:psbP domain-containing protein, chloroplastic-like [Raphidocelis subcapitata]|uniref:PsbP domain-containing protein, chloroplastic-like n=1 Tax=Raphidocelis subcapitata TaxID=307507 RepID=A0A2V0NT25_9CHLO|nr:psbP domain-containing protein, chloroplastic-like [Raphidocelis subcapitata]|eukprot:GBF90784.1 psbP domain-containing protein, chloroplastic-like [Raphidocelis subcapitata]
MHSGDAGGGDAHAQWRRAAAAAACGTLAAAAVALLGRPGAVAAEALVPYVNAAQHYSLAVPEGWERKGKAGADVLFEDPEKRSTSVGVTVSPVRVESIEQFGSLEAVGQRLLDTEAKKESTLDVRLVSESSRRGANGALLYDYEYELSSTRGRKRIVNTVSITGSKLYILNGQFKCAKEACEAGSSGGEDGGAADASSADAGGGEATAAALAALRGVAASFDAGVAAQ